ncbi:Phosphoribosylaminoimidazole-succinocarboxamide synthase [Smittium culicis]|uniref:Phosphoribosylaminoimidazole-succinocarboxamide synthase n=1 Tax=Smittium culicis TaxID=133412 RepID=A0A1R1X1T0_9FUNG|nr:Phosphoribosylaminoimidazole-succinocarboxamide synthase [Smittium culicis]OMJ22096.1 Phosphoribosylaminoimidazole-succinocarboxamide synthase [Smittium culicis]
MSKSLIESNLPDLELVARGKVRELYKVGEDALLFIATDRISAFDVIMKTPIEGKGKILTQLSTFWFDLLKDIVPNHFITSKIDEMPENVAKYRDQIENRSLLVKRLTVLPIEAIVRGYLSGSAWNEYKQSGTVHGIQMPENMRESQKLPHPIFTPSTKAEYGEHDINIHPDETKKIIGEELAQKVAEVSVKLYETAAEFAIKRGIIIADTKFEFGVDADGQLYLIDEVLTPDSSRFWPASTYKVGKPQQSYDKQYLRDYLDSISFDKATPIDLPPVVSDDTLRKYIEAFVKLTGKRPDLL